MAFGILDIDRSNVSTVSRIPPTVSTMFVAGSGEAEGCASGESPGLLGQAQRSAERDTEEECREDDSEDGQECEEYIF